MLDRLKRWVKDAGPPRTPGLTLLHFDGSTLTFRARQRFPLQFDLPLSVGLADGSSETATLRLLTRETHNREELTYTADVVASVAVRRRLFELYGVAQKGPSVPERRAHNRLAHRIRVRSRQLPNYQAVTEDMSTGGMRLVADGEMEAGCPVDLEMHFDHTRFEALHAPALVVWCLPRDTRTWWVGTKFRDLPAASLQTMAAFLHEVTEARVRGLQREHDL